MSDRAVPVVDAAIAASVLGLQAQALQAMAQQQGWPLAVKAADDGRYLAANAAFAALMGRAADEVVGRVTPCLNDDLNDCDLIIEAAIENMEIKKKTRRMDKGIRMQEIAQTSWWPSGSYEEREEQSC